MRTAPPLTIPNVKAARAALQVMDDIVRHRMEKRWGHWRHADFDRWAGELRHWIADAIGALETPPDPLPPDPNRESQRAARDAIQGQHLLGPNT